MNSQYRVVKHAPKPGSEKHRRILSASKIPAILGLSPWKTPAEQWLEMTGRLEPEITEADYLTWGHVAEASLIDWWHHHNPDWKLSRRRVTKTGASREVTYTNDSLGFDNIATLDAVATLGDQQRILECKTSNNHTLWADGLPETVLAQVMGQMIISGIHQATVIAQVGSSVPELYEVEYDHSLAATMVQVLTDFMATLDADQPPAIDEHLIDEELDKIVDPSFDDSLDLDTGDVDVIEYLQAEAQYLAAKEHLEEIKESLIEEADGREITINGKNLATLIPGRFSTARVPKEARHLLKDPEVMTPKLDAKKFAEKYPDIATIAAGNYTYRFSPKGF